MNETTMVSSQKKESMEPRQALAKVYKLLLQVSEGEKEQSAAPITDVSDTGEVEESTLVIEVHAAD